MSGLKWHHWSCAAPRMWTMVYRPPKTSDDVPLRSMIHQLIDVCHTIQQAPPKCSRRDVDSPDSSDQIIFFLSGEIQSRANFESNLKCITSAPFFQFFVSKRNTFASGLRDLQFVISIFFHFLVFEYLIWDFWVLLSLLIFIIVNALFTL